MNLIKHKFALFLCLAFLASCNDDSNKGSNELIIPVVTPLSIELTTANKNFVIGDKVELVIMLDSSFAFTDTKVSVGDEEYMLNSNSNFTLDTKEMSVGKFLVNLTAKGKDGKTYSDLQEIILFSDVEPEYKTVFIEKELAHNQKSYTQGLEFYKGKLYEGTGRNNQSILAEVDLITGAHLRSVPLDGQYFGEGITILNDTIYQITWQSGKCLIYDMDFKQIGEFNYDGDGWGLCNNGKQIIMSNGTDQIVWRDPRTFEIIKSMYVFTDQESVFNLNELELINGRLFANVYTEKFVVEIDTTNGKVLSKIDCNSLVVAGTQPGSDVLNGIAYNQFTGKTYMTGKWWPKMFEVRIE
ncbi:glutaminyl-peptide cyclotransferase [Crocinitomix catalasitica]|uniref:glutaminyl-peptide cyclotransferase n=1 Tax=Crocinitomix catalasitica TaxID=184607 RepID=UPI0012FC75AE|nr:glutaminyl-peptide cyclotransferase [Crocinitomix catalasitica]